MAPMGKGMRGLGTRGVTNERFMGFGVRSTRGGHWKGMGGLGEVWV